MSKNNPRIGLGTAQFGVDYGISNTTGKVSKVRIAQILDCASAAGISVLDTASSYGNSETLIGSIMNPRQPLRIITKTPVVKNQKVAKEDVQMISDSFTRSLERLKKKSVFGLLIHHGTNLMLSGGEYLVEALKELKQAGLVEKIGVSVYSGDEIDQILTMFIPDIIQLPYNAADRRLEQSGHLTCLKELGIEIHARSIFLQGLLLMDTSNLPKQFKSLKTQLGLFHASAGVAGMSVLEACIYTGIVRPELDIILVGVTTPEELNQIFEACFRIDQYEDNPDLYFPIIEDDCFLDPSQWKIG